MGSLLLSDAIHTVLRVIFWTLLAWFMGIGLAIFLFRIHVVRPLTLTLINLAKQASPLAWMPFAIILFGIGEPAVGAVMLIALLLPATVITMDILMHVPGALVEEASLCGATEQQILWHLRVPVCMGQFLSLLRLLWSLGWQTIIAAEMLGVANGLGFRLLDFRYLTAYREMMVYLLLIMVIGYGGDVMLQRLVHRFEKDSLL